MWNILLIGVILNLIATLLVLGSWAYHDHDVPELLKWSAIIMSVLLPYYMVFVLIRNHTRED